MKGKRHNKTKITVGSILQAKVGELEKTTREGRSRNTRKKVVVFVQDVEGKKNLLFQFQYEQKKEISYSSLMFLSSKEKVDMNEPLSNSLKK